MTETVSGGAGPARGAARKGKTGLRVDRVYTTAGVHPYDEVTWERRDVVMTNWRDGSINFEQRGVEFPDFWSVNAANIVTTKYFRGAVGTPQRESSLRQLIDRVVNKYVETGAAEGYFASPEDAEIFNHELTWMLLHQVFSFNSPVWFNVGTSAPQQVSACQPYDSLVSTPEGLVPIGRLVETNAVGTKVYDAHGLTSIVAVKANGTKDVLRLHTKAGYTLDVTADHLVWLSTGHGTGRFVPAGTLRPGDALEWHRRDAHGRGQIDTKGIAEAALAGWLQSDGFVGQCDHGTDTSLTIEAMTVTDAERDWVVTALSHVFPDVHSHERNLATQDSSLDGRRIRLDGEHLRPFVERWGLLAPGPEMEVPDHLFTAPLPVVAAYLRSIFQADGYVSPRAASTVVAVDLVGERHVRGLQSLLLRFGIFSRVSHKKDMRGNRQGTWTVRIQNEGDRDLFETEIGFIDPAKSAKLAASFDKPGLPARPTKRMQIARIEKLGPAQVYDIQTESGEYLSGSIRVHNCFILSVDDTMDSILNWYKEEGIIFKGGSGAGLNLSRIRSSKELLSSGGTASGPVSFMRGADASAGTIKSGGATRRAAKMVVLDVDHPDIVEFIDTKAREEDKIRVLRDAGYDMDLGGRDITSVQYQNANNSVRVTDEFMRAVDEGKEFGLRARTDGRVLETLDAKALFRRMAQAAWECADPGIQYDDTINDWHTSPETGRITASNPCFPADQRVVTDEGLVRIGDLVERAAGGESFAVYTNDVTSGSDPVNRVEATLPTQYMVTGTKEILELRFSDGSRLRCTPNHRVWTSEGWVRAEDLTDAHQVTKSVVHAPRVQSPQTLPEVARRLAGRSQLALPEKWSEELAHYLGWLVGDGCLTASSATTVYGSSDDIEHVLPRHQDLLAAITGFHAKPSVQANGTVQLRSGKQAVINWLAALGVSSKRAAEKAVPEAIYTAPEEALIGFLQGLFDADGCVVSQPNGTRYAGLGSRSEELVLGVQELLASLGIHSRIYAMPPKGETFTYTTVAGESRTYATNGLSYDLRITGRSLREFAAQVSFSLPAKVARLADALDGTSYYNTDETVRLVSRESKGFETTYNLTEPRNHSYVVSGIVVANCSEYMHLDNSSCNLASLNLMKFLRDDDTFDTTTFAKAVEFVITAMDISICFADFPTKAITETTKAYRQLGIGYANLGALLMATGHAYDSEGGRALAAAITSLMQATAYRRSAEIAAIVGPYDGYARNAEAHQRVIRKHIAANDGVRPVGADDARVLKAATKAWEKCAEFGQKNGYRNSQASVLAPTGTIGLMMDCDTTGIEPDLALVKLKKLVGGGSMQIVNQTVPRALTKLGYQPEQVEAILEHIAEHGHVIDAPGLRPEHYEVFDCAMGVRSIPPMGHVRMMAAVQPFISGAISKTVNMPESATVEDVEHIYYEGWKLGLKALAIYRDNCKVGQPLSDARAKKEQAPAAAVVEQRPTRKRLPKVRPSTTVSFSVGGAEGYMTAGSYPDDGLGEVFIKMSKQGSTLAGVMDAFSIAISIGLQYGVPLDAFVSKYINMRFDPAGLTDDPDVRMAQSVMDYIFRRLALDYLPHERRAELGIFTAEERAQAVASSSYGASPALGEDEAEDVESLRGSAPVEHEPVAVTTESETPPTGGGGVVGQTAVDAPLCFTCGVKMRPAGSCYVCESCGSTSGCS